MTVREISRVIGYVPQNIQNNFDYTVYEYVLMGRVAHKRVLEYPNREDRDVANEAIDTMGLGHLASRSFNRLSGGEQQQACIARALAQSPELIIMDEPTAGLDPKERAYFRNVISEMAQDKIIIISTHIVSDIEYISDQVIIMKKGRFILQGTTEELTAEAEGMVWSCRVPVREWAAFEISHTVANSRNLGERVEARVISPERPYADAEQAEPTLEDLYLKCFSDELGMLEQVSGKKRRGRS